MSTGDFTVIGWYQNEQMKLGNIARPLREHIGASTENMHNEFLEFLQGAFMQRNDGE